MSDLSNRLAALTAEQRAQLSAQLSAKAARQVDPSSAVTPIAIIGIGCRFPGGANSPAAFWKMLCDGRSGVCEIPPERWNTKQFFSTDPTAAGKSTSRWAGLLERVDAFDREFFGLSPREVIHMDPQQRILLEVAWEALESAGQTTDGLAESSTGVFVGAHSHSSDYFLLQARDRNRLDTYTATGTAHSILANRLSFTWDLRGPSLTIDTACSSSLVAIHTACQSLRLGECDLAIGAGVNLIVSPEFQICLGKMEMMAEDGRCKTFDHRANGFVRGEGCGAVVLKRWPDAVRDGDPVLALIVGSAVNQDGASNGLTAPSGSAQQAVVRKALQVAGISPSAVDYVETHGTGTVLGDPIEVEALAAVLSPGREAQHKCILGAVKTNLGHLEAAAGIAGLIKAVLCLQEQVVPPNLHFERANPHLELSTTPFVLPNYCRAWPVGDQPRVCGVSSFGFGGTNAHVVLADRSARGEKPSTVPTALGPKSDCISKTMHLLPISARSPEALRAFAESYIEFLATGPGPAMSLDDICYTAAVRRSHHDHRLVAVGASSAELVSDLRRQLEKPVPHEGTCREGAATEVVTDFSDYEQRWPAYYVAGYSLLWRKLFSPDCKCVSLPSYPWQRQRYWFEESTSQHKVDDTAIAGKISDRFYDLVWELNNPIYRHGARGAFAVGAALEPLVERLATQLPALRATSGIQSDTGFLAELDRISVSHIVGALKELGFDFSAGGRHPCDAVSKHLQIAPRHERLFERLLDILRRQGLLSRDAGDWVTTHPADPFELPTNTHSLVAKYRDAQDILELQQRCGEKLAQVLRGDCDPLSLLFSSDDKSSAEAIYRDAPPSRLSNRVAAQAIAAHIADLPSHRTLRILEIGAGTGATTGFLLPHLPAARCEYVFTDLSRLFLQRAAARFADYPFVRYEILNLEQAPETQGFAPGQFDIVVAANVIHATQNVRQSLQNICSLLVPDGVLLLVEGTAARPWIDITFGLTDGWWRFADHDLRSDHPLLDQETWLATLQQHGFKQCAALPLQESGTALFDQALFLARKAAVEPVRDALRIANPEAGRHYVLFEDSPGIGKEVARQLRARGDRCSMVQFADAYRDLGEGDFRVRGDDAEGIGELFKSIGDSLEAVVCFSDSSTADVAGATTILRQSCRPLLLAQAMVAHNVSPARGLWFVSRDAQAVNADDPVTGMPQSTLWGWGRGIALEHPELWGGLIDLDGKSSADLDAFHLLAELDDRTPEDQIAYRDGDRYLLRLERAALSTEPAAPRIEAEAMHLITGGLGGLGSQLAEWLAEAGARHLLLTSRRPLPPRAAWDSLPSESSDRARVDAIRRLEARGVDVRVATVDVADFQAMERLFKTIADSGLPLRSVWHTALAFSSSPLAALTIEQARSMLDTKAQGAWNLHCLTAQHQLDHFVLFSSTTALWGARGLAHYAAANAFVDSLAHFRRSNNLPAQAINWGTWMQMQALSTSEREQAARVGLRPMPAQEALAALKLITGSEFCQKVVADIDWSVFKAAYETRRSRPLLARLGGNSKGNESASGDLTSTAAPARLELLDRIEAALPEQRREVLCAHLQKEVAQVLGMQPDVPVDRRSGFFDLGMDSLTSVQLRRRLESGLQRPLPPTLTFNYPTIDSLANFLMQEALGLETLRPTAAVDQVEPSPETRPLETRQSAMRSDNETEEVDDASEDELLLQLAERLARRPS